MGAVTLAELLSRVPAATLATRDPVQIATSASIGRTVLVATTGGIGTVLNALGPTDGAALLDTLTAAATHSAALRWAMVLVNDGALDFGAPGTRAQLDALATAGIIPLAHAVALKALAERPDPVTEFDVRVALWADDGTWLGG